MLGIGCSVCYFEYCKQLSVLQHGLPTCGHEAVLFIPIELRLKREESKFAKSWAQGSGEWENRNRKSIEALGFESSTHHLLTR